MVQSRAGDVKTLGQWGVVGWHPLLDPPPPPPAGVSLVCGMALLYACQKINEHSHKLFCVSMVTSQSHPNKNERRKDVKESKVSAGCGGAAENTI